MSVRTKKTPALHIAALSVITAAAAVLQTTVFNRLKLFGASPDIMLGLTVAVSAYFGKREGAVQGIFAGFVVDCLGTSGLSLSPLLYFLCGYFSGVLFARSISRSWFSFLTAISVALVPRAAATLISLQFYKPDYPLNTAFVSVIIPEAVSSLLFSLLVRLVFLLFSAKPKRSAAL